MIDFHCHLDLFPEPDVIAMEIDRRNLGVLSVTTTPSAWPGTSRLSRDRRTIRTALGLHPELARERKHELALFENYLPQTQFVGEVGLDGSPALRSSWNDQVEVFESILDQCAHAGGKILSIHSRRAATPVLDALTDHSDSGHAILHWFSGTAKELRRAISLDCWFSVGPAMLHTAKGRELVTSMPPEKILLETDSPFAQIKGGGVLQPWDVDLAAQILSSLWNLQPSDARARIRSNEHALLSSKQAT